MINSVVLIGHLGQDVIMHTFENGEKIAKATLATTEKWRDKQTQELKEKTTWHNLVFGKFTADLAEKYLSKGSKIYVQGKISNRSYEKDGVKHYITEIMVRDLKFLDSKPSGSENKAQVQSNNETPKQETGEKDDLPF